MQTTALLAAGIDGWVTPFQLLRIFGEALVSAPLPAVSARDNGRALAAVSGVGVEAALGIRVAF